MSKENVRGMQDDAISREQAINATWQDTGYTDPFNVMTAIRDRIKQLPPIQPVNCSEFPNNSDTISRQAAIDALGELATFTADWSYNTWMYTDDVYNAIKQLPPIQPDIVRCKDCKHWKDSDGVFRRGTGAESKCPLNLHQVYEGTFFCGLAERREVQDENDKTTNNTTNA